MAGRKTAGVCGFLFAAVFISFAQTQISGIYPHLAAFGPPNTNSGCYGGKDETGIGAVVPWAGRLWFLTYSSHCPTGSGDKLYSVDQGMNLTTRPESIGGTPANRLIHRESNQLFIGPYAIDSLGNVRVISYSVMPGRHTATARHLTDPVNKVYYIEMEGQVWEVDVSTLQARRLFYKPVPGWHAKGAYTGQGRLIVSNNGEIAVSPYTYDSLKAGGAPVSPEDAGVLAQWNGTTWSIVDRRQFTDVTGPGGIRGAPDDTSPVWSMGWDKRSVLLKVLDHGIWYTYRLPKGSHSYEHNGGWYTEWPRIREVTNGKYLMDMFAMFYDFPPTFDAAHTGGILPIATHLRYIPDFCGWDDRIVLATDETSAFTANNPIAGHSQSNLWFGTWNQLFEFGPRNGWGGPWLDDSVKANVASAPYLINGFHKKVLHLIHNNAASVQFTIEMNVNGNNVWQTFQTIGVPAGTYRHFVFPAGFAAQWIRLKSDRDCIASAYVHYSTSGHDPQKTRTMFAGLADITDTGKVLAGLVRPPHDINNLQFLQLTTPTGALAETYYEVSQQMAYTTPVSRATEVKNAGGRTKDFDVDSASVIVTYDSKRYRLPLGNARYSQMDATNWWPRGIRQVESERNYMNVHGTFYEIPLEGGMEKVRPICTHNKQISDYCSWSGLLVLSGVRAAAAADGNTFMSSDNRAGLWFGSVDDLWKLGQPVGIGGPWKNTAVTANTASDPYLMTGYDKKTMLLSHNGSSAVNFTVEVNFDHIHWGIYNSFTVAAGQTVTHEFPDGYSAHWVRLRTDRAVTATAQFIYDTSNASVAVMPACNSPDAAQTFRIVQRRNCIFMEYALASGSTVLSLYTIQGKRIATCRGLGVRRVTWKTSDLPSGIYCLQLSEGSASLKTATFRIVK